MPQPDILLIVADDMGFSDAGCYGGEISTPNLDALAAGGLRFTQHYSAGRCWPSRACLTTGYYYEQVPQVPDDLAMPDWGRTLPHYLKPAGYRCYHSGKWHVNQVPGPATCGGFDRSYYIRDYDRNFAVREHSLDDKPLPPVEPGSGYYSTTAIASHAVDFLDEHAREHADKPLMLYLPFIAPHFPLHAPQADIEVYRGRYADGWDEARARRLERMQAMGLLSCDLSPRQARVKPAWNLASEELAERIGPGEAPAAVAWKSLDEAQREFQAMKMEIHAAMIHRMDREIGRVIDRLRAMGRFENTVILFVSDNGASAEQIIRGDGHDKTATAGSGGSYLCLGPGWSTAANTPFRYHKSWVHEGGVASPLIVHWPAGIRDAGTLRSTPSHFVDILPTLVELAGASLRPDWRGDDTPDPSGVSLAPALRSGGDEAGRDVQIERECIYFSHIGHRGIRQGRWKLVAVDHGRWELYDMQADRSELHNLAANQPERVERMKALWQRLSKTYAAQIGERRKG